MLCGTFARAPGRPTTRSATRPGALGTRCVARMERGLGRGQSRSSSSRRAPPASAARVSGAASSSARPQSRSGAHPDRMVVETDVRIVLPASACRRWCSTARRSSCRSSCARYLAEHIPGAGSSCCRARTTSPSTATPTATSRDRGVPHRRAPRRHASDRVLATVLFTDIVGSTERAAQLGDARWRDAPRRAHDVARAPSSSASAAARSRRGRRLPRHLRRPGARDPLRARRSATGVRALGLELRAGAAHRRVRADRRRRSAASPSTSARGSRRWPARTRCSCRAPSRTWSSARGSRSPTAARMRSRASRASGGFMPSRRSGAQPRPSNRAWRGRMPLRPQLPPAASRRNATFSVTW